MMNPGEGRRATLETPGREFASMRDVLADREVEIGEPVELPPWGAAWLRLERS